MSSNKTKRQAGYFSLQKQLFFLLTSDLKSAVNFRLSGRRVFCFSIVAHYSSKKKAI